MIVKRDFPALAEEDLLASFANLGHDGPDELAAPAGLRTWWQGLGAHAPAPTEHDDADLVALRALRVTVRGLALAHNGVDPEVDPEVAPDALDGIGFRLRVGAAPGLRPEAPGLGPEVAAAVATALLRASARPAWSRLKACPGPGCAWVFRDTTRNGSRRWCQMSECGNRAKGAAFRARASARD